MRFSESFLKDTFQLPQLPVLPTDLAEYEKNVVTSVCLRPEIQPLSRSVAFKIEKNIETPFQVPTGDQIILNSIILKHQSLAAVFIRYALELTIWHRLINGNASLGIFIAIAFLSAHTTKIYWETITERERKLCRLYIPDELSKMLDDIEKWELVDIINMKSDDELRHLAIKLLKLQAIDNIPDDNFSEQDFYEARNFISKGYLVASPVEHLLTTGGDDRLKIDKKTGLNNYGCSPKPRPWAITFASTTATSISDYAFIHAEKLRERLIESVCMNNFESQYIFEIENVRSKILKAFGLNEIKGTELIFSTSGTDAEMFAIYLSSIFSNDPVINILVGPEETGSGVILSASGHHFAKITPLGNFVSKGEAIEGVDITRIRIAEIPIRKYDGPYLDIEKIDHRVNILVKKAIASGNRVLIHIVDSSKTGLLAPSEESIIQLKEMYGEYIDVVVDACQLRACNKKLKKYLKAGFMLMITGSKFFTGPPFSGALIIPANIVKRFKRINQLPKGFSDYYTTYDLPDVCFSLRSNLNSNKNIGLLLRWEAALWEIIAFQAVSDKHKYLIYTLFGESIREVITANPNLKLVPTPFTERWKLPHGKEWDWLPTIFTFVIQRTGLRGQRIFLSYEEARKIYHWLNMDISGLLPPEVSGTELQLAKKRCHIGQAVKISLSEGNWVGALRISAGARLVSGICFDPELGRHFSERLSKEIGDACSALDKISLIIKYMNFFEHNGECIETYDDSELPYII